MRGWKLQIDFNEENKQFDLCVNLDSSENLPYRAPTTGKKGETDSLKGFVAYNSVPIFDGAMQWH